MIDRTVREFVREIQAAVRDDAFVPQEAAVKLARLSGLYGNTLKETRESELAYKRVLLAAYSSEETANRAVILAETSPEYQRYREARDTERLVLEMMRALKRILQSLSDEMRLAR